MKLHSLPKTSLRPKKRRGRGYGSGKGGHTSGRGAKGAKARGKIPLAFTGTKLRKSFLKKLPLQRGKGRFKPLTTGPIIVPLRYLNIFNKGERVDPASLVKKGLVDARQAARYGIKILGDGELSVNLIIATPVSRAAAARIENAGGKIEKAAALSFLKDSEPLRSRVANTARKAKDSKSPKSSKNPKPSNSKTPSKAS